MHDCRLENRILQPEVTYLSYDVRPISGSQAEESPPSRVIFFTLHANSHHSPNQRKKKYTSALVKTNIAPSVIIATKFPK